MMTSRNMLLAVLIVSACETNAPTQTAPESQKPLNGADKVEERHVDEPEHEELPTRVHLTAEVVKKAGVVTEKATREILPATVSLPGEVVADPDRSAEISAPLAGRLERIDFREGSTVKKGDVLALLRVHDLAQLRAAYDATLAKAKAARTNAERLKDLSAKRLASEQAYLDAAAQADALDIEARAASLQLAAVGASAGNGAGSTLALRAPVAGTVVMRQAVVGQPVTADQSIGRIVDLSRVWFLGRVFEKDVSKVHPGASAEVELNAYPEQRFVGVVEYVGRKVDPNARTLTARVALANRGDLLSVGLFGTAHVSTVGNAVQERVLVVPRSALTEIAGKQAVFVRHPDADYEVHEVVVGDSAGGKVHILNGLREGEEVVVAGVFTLKSAVLKSTFAEEE